MIRNTRTIRAATVQFNHAPGDKKYNFSRIEYFSTLAAQSQVNVIAFPEMCITGYWHVRHLNRNHIMQLAESVTNGDSVTRLKALSSDLNMIIGAGLIEKATDGKMYNTYVVALPDGNAFSHRKLHCFISPHMDSGNQYTVFDTLYGFKAGVLTCWDNNLVENVRITALQGADILFAPHQTGGCNSRSPFGMKPIDPRLWINRKQDPKSIEAEFYGPNGRGWLMRWLPSRAHDNGLFILFSNGVGIDDDEVRTGNAMIIDCYGRIMNETWEAKDALITADLDLNLLDMCTGRRWIRGRRPELYNALAESMGNEMDPRTARFSKKSTK